MAIEKVILKNQPIENSCGQYNLGNLNPGDPLTLLGKEPSNIENVNADLYSVSEQKHLNIDKQTGTPNGRLWNYVGTQLKISSISTSMNSSQETDGGRYKGVAHAIYIYDGSTETGKAIGDATTGTEIKDAIGLGDKFDQTVDSHKGNRIGYWALGEQRQNVGIGDLLNPNDAGFGGMPSSWWNLLGPVYWAANYAVTNYGGSVGIGTASVESNFDTDLIVRNFPVQPSVEKTDGTIITIDNWNFDIDEWTSWVYNETEDNTGGDMIWIVVRGAADEREYAPFKTVTDERNRVYGRLGIKKSKLKSILTSATGQSITIDKNNADSWDGGTSLQDSYGNNRGHRNFTTNHKSCINSIDNITIQITAPNWTPQKANKPFSEGGANARWINSTDNDAIWWCLQEYGFNPKYDIDYTGFPSDSPVYNKPGVYFSGKDLEKFRSVVEITSVADTYSQDLMNYYPLGSEGSIYSSAPIGVELSMQLTEDNCSYSPEIVSNSDLDYYFFVVNWNWEDGDPGGGDSCNSWTTVEGSWVNIGDCVGELGQQFPATVEEWEALSLEEDLYKLTSINNGESTTHYYNQPGLKIIKALVFSSMTSTRQPNYRQALRWELVTIRINLSNDNSYESDFDDVGGSDFVYLPYPEQIVYNSEGDVLTPQGGDYKSSHPIIGGLSPDSEYVKSLDAVRRQDAFGEAEQDDKIVFLNAYENTPGGTRDEYGRYFGNSDIQQVRYFANGTFDMKKQLGLSVVHSEGENENIEYYLRNYDALDDYGNPYWNCEDWEYDRNKCFPMESPVGSIFINDYYYFRDDCLFEINAESINQKTIRDSSGNGNKAILIGDYSVTKEEINDEAVRDSYIELPEIEEEPGAI